MNEVVTINPKILGGTPCFTGTRVPVRSLFDHLKIDYGIDEFLAQFPTVKKTQVTALLDQVEHQFDERAREPAHR